MHLIGLKIPRKTVFAARVEWIFSRYHSEIMLVMQYKTHGPETSKVTNKTTSRQEARKTVKTECSWMRGRDICAWRKEMAVDLGDRDNGIFLFLWSCRHQLEKEPSRLAARKAHECWISRKPIRIVSNCTSSTYGEGYTSSWPGFYPFSWQNVQLTFTVRFPGLFRVWSCSFCILVVKAVSQLTDR